LTVKPLVDLRRSLAWQIRLRKILKYQKELLQLKRDVIRELDSMTRKYRRVSAGLERPADP